MGTRPSPPPPSSAQFQSTLTLTAAAPTADADGSTHHARRRGPPPVVLRRRRRRYTQRRSATRRPPAGHRSPARSWSASAACNGRVEKGFNVIAGGAAGHDPRTTRRLADDRDRQPLPADRPPRRATARELLAFLAAHPGATADVHRRRQGRRPGRRDGRVLLPRPGRPVLKPDVTAPGVQILAGHTPVPDDVAGGPPGQYFQAIAGTSMSSPHIAGSAALLLSAAPDVDAGPDQVGADDHRQDRASSRRTATTPADPFDVGAGRVDLTQAGNPGLTFDETAAELRRSRGRPAAAVDLNIPSINAPVMPGIADHDRTVTNVTGPHAELPRERRLGPGWRDHRSRRARSRSARPQLTLKVTIDDRAPRVDRPGTVGDRPGADDHRRRADAAPAGRLRPRPGRRHPRPVAATPPSIAQGDQAPATSTVDQQRPAPVDRGRPTTLSERSCGSPASTARPDAGTAAGHRQPATLAGHEPASPSVGPGDRLRVTSPLACFGVTPDAARGRGHLNFNVPAFVYGDEHVRRRSACRLQRLARRRRRRRPGDNCCNLPVMPDPAAEQRAGAVLDRSRRHAAPGSAGRRCSTDGPATAGSSSSGTPRCSAPPRPTSFQMQWIGLNGTQDISFAYDPPTCPAGARPAALHRPAPRTTIGSRGPTSG